MKAVPATVSCCALLAITGCGGSTSTSSTSGASAAHSGAGATSATVPTTLTTTASATTRTATAAKGDAPADAAAAPGAAAEQGGAGRSGSATGLARDYGSLATYGGEASGEVRAAILVTLHRYLSALAAGDWGAACGQLAAPVEGQLELLIAHAKSLHGKGCAAALGALLGRGPSVLRQQEGQLSVISVRIDGDHAVVLYRSPQLPHATLSMVRESGQWKAGVLSGSSTG